MARFDKWNPELCIVPLARLHTLWTHREHGFKLSLSPVSQPQLFVWKVHLLIALFRPHDLFSFAFLPWQKGWCLRNCVLFWIYHFENIPLTENKQIISFALWLLALVACVENLLCVSSFCWCRGDLKFLLRKSFIALAARSAATWLQLSGGPSWAQPWALSLSCMQVQGH